MPLMTADELARGALLIVFGGAAGVVAMVAPGTAWWAVPGALGLAAGAATVPEVRAELVRSWPALAEGVQQARAALPHVAWQLPGVKAEQRPPQEARSRAAARQPAPVTEQTPASGEELFDALEGPPHRLIIGHSRGGKTTLIHHMATSWAARGERVLVGDPDAAPGLWPGCEVRGAGDDIGAISELLEVVAVEVEARRQARAQGVRRFPPLHLVVDEAQEVLPVIDGGLELFETLARRGGKLNVRMTIGVQDKQVKTLGLKGKSEVLRNLQLADVLKTRDGRRVAILRDPETGERVSMAIPPLTDPESLIVTRPATEMTQNLRCPPVPASASAPADSLLASLLAESVPSHQDAEGTVVNPVPGNGMNGEGGGHSSVTVEGGNGGNVTVNATLIAPQPAAKGDRTARTAYERALVEVYRALGAEGVTFSKAYAQHKGTKEVVFTAWQEGRATRRESQ